MKPQQQEQIKRHGEMIKEMFNLNKELDALKLCKLLRRLENKAHRLTTKGCNEELTKQDEQVLSDILFKLDCILNYSKQNIKVFINYDARGYALKIKDTDEILKKFPHFSKDWGGYGIIAPEIN